MKKVIFLLVACAVSGCDDSVAKNTRSPIGKIKQGDNGLMYILTCVEDYKFVATQGSYGYWTLSGPIGKCDNT